jgi:cyclase
MTENKSVMLLCLLIASSLTIYVSTPAQENSELIRLGDRVYVEVAGPDAEAVSNSGVLILDHAVLVFDTHFTPEAGQSLLSGIRSLTSKPVRYVINSHFHPDHTHGNQVFGDAQLISSTSGRRNILEADLPSLNRTIEVTKAQVRDLRRGSAKEAKSLDARHYGDQIRSRQHYLDDLSRLRILAPCVTVDDSLTIQDGSWEVRILFLGEGHTDGDVVLVFPSAKVAFLGDLFFNEAIPNVQDANILKWMTTLQNVLKLDADIFVPGHGPVGDRKAVEGFLRYFEELKALVVPLVKRGDSMEQAIRDVQMPVKYSNYRFQNFFPVNVQKMYAEVKALQIASARPEKQNRPDSRKEHK